MDSQKQTLVLRFLPSFTDLAFLAVLMQLFGLLPGVPMLLSDGDTGWHIRTGDWILSHGRIPERDLFSYSKPGQPWFAWEWLWDVIFAWLHQHGGMAAVVLATILLLCLTVALLFRLIRRKCGNVFLAFLVTLLAMEALSLHWLARPLIVTPLFTVIFYSLLERAREGNRRLLILLPFLMVLWTNLHGGFGAGLVVVGAYAVGELLAALVEPEGSERRAALSRAKAFGLALAACGSATFLNPYGYRLHAHIYTYLLNPYYRRYVEEFSSLSFQHPGAIFFEALILLGAVAAYRCFQRKQFVYPLLFLIWAHAALVALRNIPIFAVVAAPMIGMMLYEWVGAVQHASVNGWVRRLAAAFEQETAEFSETDRIERFHIVSALAMVFVAALLFAPSPPRKIRPEFDAKKFPVAAAAALRKLDPEAKVLATDSWGGYLIYTFYPSRRVFIDGRSDFYGPAFCDTYRDIMSGKRGWQQKVDKYGISAILVPVDAPLTASLRESGVWAPIYEDDLAVLFTGPRPSAESSARTSPLPGSRPSR